MRQQQKESKKTIAVLKDILVIGLGFVLFSTSLPAVEFTVVENPKPTFTEKKYVTLVKANQICDSHDDENFLAFPRAMTVDHMGNLYVFDTAQVKVLKYDRNLKFVKSCGQKGEGPKDFSVFSRYTKVEMFCNDINLYVFIVNRRQLVVLDLNLNYIDEFRLNPGKKYINPCFAVNKSGDFVFYSSEGKGSILVLDSKMKLKSKFSIDLKLFDFLFFTPPECLVDNRLNRFHINIKHALLKDSKLVIYSLDTSTLFIFKNNRLEKRFNIYSRKILDDFKPQLAIVLKELSDSFKKEKGLICGYRSLFTNFFIDNDTGGSFYLEYRDIKKKTTYLYNFDFEGKLVQISQFESRDTVMFRTAFLVKRNHLFFGIANQNEIVTYKEKSHEKKPLTARIHQFR